MFSLSLGGGFVSPISPMVASPVVAQPGGEVTSAGTLGGTGITASTAPATNTQGWGGKIMGWVGSAASWVIGAASGTNTPNTSTTSGKLSAAGGSVIADLWNVLKSTATNAVKGAVAGASVTSYSASKSATTTSNELSAALQSPGLLLAGAALVLILLLKR